MSRHLFAFSFAAAGALTFAASLLFFLYSYLVTFALPFAGPMRLAPVVWNASIFSVFALHHSVFAREGVRAWIGRVVPAGLERSVYVWIASLLLVAVCRLWQPVAGIAWQLSGGWSALLWVVQAAGVWLTLRGAGVIDIFELNGMRQVQPRSRDDAAAPGFTTPEFKTPDFKTSGPYGWMRHPIYTGWFLLVFAVTPMTSTRLVFAVVSCAYLIAAIPLEERSLRRSSGGAYDAYMRKVPWKLLPGVF